MSEIIIATKNKGKAEEFKKMFAPLGYEVKTLHDYPDMPDVEETGTTFEANAVLKAEEISRLMNRPVIADDSGLSIDALEGRPGIFSARYAGEDKNDEANIDKVLEEMKHVPEEKRDARFYCALAVAIPGKKTYTVSGTCEGKILYARKGTNGFGYDPIFWANAKNKAMAELTSEEKAAISHRGQALKQLEKDLPTIL
ncbi:XTP/dITP diphosphatase [Cytobacillus kochii]|uniref:XTP/dITP diphosphatase n=1 Tax=Cytobacillus kochii TaxID=859143 RepID=UPI001CD2A6C7|nr:XTP/dITP diphosphatase [Cytobacillus kochii]MCA1025263.1 XTP/dITP diphosphatase [Cytobacillus kochii]